MKVNSIHSSSDISAFVGVTDIERKSLARDYIAFEALVFIHFGLAMLGYVPLWTFCIAVFYYVPRWMIALHELQHACTPKTINPITKHNFLILTPFQLGYRELRDIHMRHHAYPATEKDPDYYHIRGSSLSGYINVMFSAEQSFYFWIRDKGIDTEFIKGVSIRFALFFALVLGFGWQSLWYFIPVRLAYGTSLFFFSHGLHRKNGEYGTYQITYPTMLKNIILFLYGKALFYGISEHDIHHDYPTISGHKLKAARPYYRPKKSSAKRLSENVSASPN